MGRRLPYTPNAKIKAALRQLFLRSRERAAAMKRDKYCCVRCGVKKSVAKGREVKCEVHHRSGVLNWQPIYELIRKYLLNESDMETLCESCHKKETEKQLTPKDNSVE